METAYKRSFLKDLRKLPSEYRHRVEAFALEEAVAANDLEDMVGCIKITGHEGFYRKRVGDYRIGFRVDGVTITFYRLMHRREIYRYFP